MINIINYNQHYIPKFETKGSCAIDLACKEKVSIDHGEHQLIDTGVVIQAPKGTGIILAARSSTHKKYGLMLANGIGIIDQDYCGDEDTIKMAFYKYTEGKVVIEPGTRLGQVMLVSIVKDQLNFVENISKENRGGFGSTGS